MQFLASLGAGVEVCGGGLLRQLDEILRTFCKDKKSFHSTENFLKNNENFSVEKKCHKLIKKGERPLTQKTQQDELYFLRFMGIFTYFYWRITLKTCFYLSGSGIISLVPEKYKHFFILYKGKLNSAKSHFF